MPFNLQVSFDGLCLFVPQFGTPNAADRRLHVLLVDTDGHAHEHAHEHGMPPHIARLYFDAAYIMNGATEEVGHPVHLPLANTRLVMPAVGTRIPDDPDFGAQVLSLDKISKAGALPPGHTDEAQPLPDNVAARITFSTGLPALAPAVAVCDVTPSNGGMGGQQLVDSSVVWHVPNIHDDGLTLELRDGQTGAVTHTQRLVALQGRIRLRVYCSLEEDLPGGPVPPEPTPGKDEHFHALYDIYPTPVPPATVSFVRPARGSIVHRCYPGQL